VRLGIQRLRESSVFKWFFNGNQSTVFKLDLKNPLPVTLWITKETHGSWRQCLRGITRGKVKGRLSLRRNLWGLAAKGNPAANIFLAKNLLGYKDYFANELSGPNGDPIAIGPAPELGGLNADELKQLIALLNKGERPNKG
jgi:hypothetical protein